MSKDNSKQNGSKDNGRAQTPNGTNNNNNNPNDDDDDQPMGEVIQNILATIISSMTESFSVPMTSTPERQGSSSGPALTSPDSVNVSPFIAMPTNDELDDDIELENLIDLLRDQTKNQIKANLPDSPPSSWSWKNDWKSPKKEIHTKNMKTRFGKGVQMVKLSAKLANDLDLDDDDDAGWQFQTTRKTRGRASERRLQKQVETMANDDTDLVQELCNASCRKILLQIPEYETRIKHAFDDAFMNIASHQVEIVGHFGELEKIFGMVEGAFRDRTEQLRTRLAETIKNPE